MSGESTHGRTSTPLTLCSGFDGSGARSSEEVQQETRQHWGFKDVSIYHY